MNEADQVATLLRCCYFIKPATSESLLIQELRFNVLGTEASVTCLVDFIYRCYVVVIETSHSVKVACSLLAPPYSD